MPITKLPQPDVDDDDDRPQPILYQGEKSATADRDALAEAKRRIAAGHDAREVWDDTGWQQLGAGGEWRAEIDDSGSKLKPGAIAEGTRKLGDVIDHPELAKAYPQIMHLPVNFTSNEADTAPREGGGAGVVGRYYGARRFPSPLGLLGLRNDGPEINVYLPALQRWATKSGQSPEDALRGVLLHETQHAIQDHEQWSRGQEPTPAGSSSYEQYRARTQEAEAFDAEARENLTAQQRRQTQPGALEAADRARMIAQRRAVKGTILER